MSGKTISLIKLKARKSRIKGQPGVVRIHDGDGEAIDIRKEGSAELYAAGQEGNGLFVNVVSDTYINRGYASIRQEDMERLNIREGDAIILRYHRNKGKKGKGVAKEVEIKGNRLKCIICGNDLFWSRKTLLNTRGLSFFDFDWANKNAKNYICSICGHIYWFHP